MKNKHCVSACRKRIRRLGLRKINFASDNFALFAPAPIERDRDCEKILLYSVNQLCVLRVFA